MKDMYELYKNSLHGYKKEELKSIDQTINEIALSFAGEEWFLVNGGFDGIEYVDGNDVCRLPFIKNVGLYPTRRDKNKPSFGELQALSFYVRNKTKVDALSDALIKKYKLIVSSAKESNGMEQDVAKMLLVKEQPEKAMQKVK